MVEVTGNLWDYPAVRRKLNLPRALLPRQTGGVHRVKTKVLARKAKHRVPEALRHAPSNSDDSD